MEKFIGTTVDTPEGKATISKFYFTDLGLLMVKLYFTESQRWVNYRIGDINSLLQTINVNISHE